MNHDRRLAVAFGETAQPGGLVVPLNVDETARTMQSNTWTWLGSALARLRRGMARFAAAGQIGTGDVVERARRTGARC